MNDEDYSEIVRRLTRDVVSILAARGVSASHSAVYAWLWSMPVHHEDDARTLADGWSGR